MKPLGRLERVDLREVWPNEAADFTPWLAREENLESLGDTLGLELEFEATEKKAGPYSADILCRDDDGRVVIENQLEATNHDHLGKLLTYAAHFDAHTLVWIARAFSDPHRAAIDWLNENSTEGTRYFGLEIEAWRIGDSEPAPKFNVVAKPNDWTRARKALTNDQQLRLEFWTGFRAFVEDKARGFQLGPDTRGGGSQPWMRVGYVSARGFNLLASILVKEKEIRATLQIRKGRESDRCFGLLEAQRAEIEQEMGKELKWLNPPDGFNRIYVCRDADLRDREAWPCQFEWLLGRLEDLHRVFENRVIALT